MTAQPEANAVEKRTPQQPSLAARIISAVVVVGLCVGMWWYIEGRIAPPPPPPLPSKPVPGEIPIPGR